MYPPQERNRIQHHCYRGKGHCYGGGASCHRGSASCHGGQGFFLCCSPSKWTIIFGDLSHFAIFPSLLEHDTPCKCPFGHLLSHIKQQTIGSNFYQMQHTLVLIILLLQIQSKNATILYIDVVVSYSSKTGSGHYHIRSESDFAVCCYVSSM